MQFREFPIEIQDFMSIREEGCLYAGKTRYSAEGKARIKAGAEFDGETRAIGRRLPA
jgi:hypothetical protein